MKTKLLKKLRKETLKGFSVYYNSGAYDVYYHGERLKVAISWVNVKRTLINNFERTVENYKRDHMIRVKQRKLYIWK